VAVDARAPSMMPALAVEASAVVVIGMVPVAIIVRPMIPLSPRVPVGRDRDSAPERISIVIGPTRDGRDVRLQRR
jgi:hypothetical protein